MRSTCRCPSCLSAPTAAVSRRSTTGTLGQGIRFGDVFTVFYSSVLATAAVADSEWKDAKRKDLDASIAKAIDELKATEREQDRRIQQVLLRAQSELRDIGAEGPPKPQILQGIFRTILSGKSPNAPFEELRNPWRDGGRVQTGIDVRSRAPGTGCYDGTSTATRDLWPSAEQAQMLEKGTQAEGRISGRPNDNDAGAALEYDYRPVLEANHETSVTPKMTMLISDGINGSPPSETSGIESTTTRTTLWTSDGASDRLLSEATNTRLTTKREDLWTADAASGPPLLKSSSRSSTTTRENLSASDGVKQCRKRVNIRFTMSKSRKEEPGWAIRKPGWATRNRMEKLSSVIPTTHVSTNISQDAQLASPRLRHRPSGAGAKESLQYKLDTLCLKHVRGGFPLGTLPRGQSKLNMLSLKHVRGGFPPGTLTRSQSTFDIWERAGHQTLLDGLEMSRLETSVGGLICRLLVTAIDASKCGSISVKLPDNTDRHFTKSQRKMLKMMISQVTDCLKAPEPKVDTLSHSPLIPRYLDQVEGRPGKTNLNQELLRTFTYSPNLEALLPEVCSQLLASPTPPDVHTYNILIIQLCNLQYYDLAAAAISSMFDGRINPNEITTAAILRFFNHTGDMVRFEAYADFLNHRSLNSVMRPDYETGTTTRGAAYRFEYEDMGSSNTATQKELILGWLRFGNFEHALVEYQVMVHRGYLKTRPILNRSILISILQNCVLTGNWEWGTAVWQDLMKRPNAPRGELILEQYYWMLQLCVVCGRDSQFNLVVEDGISKEKQLPEALQMSDFVSTSDEVHRLMDDVRLLEKLRNTGTLPGRYKHKMFVPRLSRIMNLRSWISESLSMFDPQRRRRAEEAGPVTHLLYHFRTPKESTPKISLAKLIKSIDEESRNASEHTQPRTLEEEVLEETDHRPLAGGDDADESQDDVPFVEAEPPQALPA